MAKLNYANRKISGAKLGTTVKKDVLKHSQSSLNSKKSVTKDPHIEINLPGKGLGDEGLRLVCEGLVEALKAGGVRLDELNLAENQITPVGLTCLADVVRLASRDLKDLDLRKNHLHVDDDQSAQGWEGFLDSFKDVCSLRRLDISENDLGHRGLEALWRVYCREPPLRISRSTKGSISQSAEDEYDTDGLDAEFLADEDEVEEIYAQARSLSISDSTTSPSSSYSTPAKLHAGKLCHRSSSQSLSTSHTSSGAEPHGLRSVPYIVFTGITITDCASLFLSYIVAAHALPDRLMAHLPAPKAGGPADILEHYKHIDRCSGIIYRPNDTLSSAADRLLECAESVREAKTTFGCESASWPRRRHSEIPSPVTPGKSRRDSLTIGATPSAGDQLERARSKIQGLILKDMGPREVELWSVALKALASARSVLFDPKASSFSAHGRSPPPPLPSPADRYGTCSLPSPITPTHLGQGYNSPQATPVRHSTAASGVLHDAWLQLTHSDPDLDQGQAPPALSPPFSKASPHIERVYPGGLPKDVWETIIFMAADPDNLLSDRQRNCIVVWAQSRETLFRERELAGKMRNQQIWRVLEGMECLAYDGASATSS